MKIEKIDVEEVRDVYTFLDVENSLKVISEKLNEIIDYINKKDEPTT